MRHSKSGRGTKRQIIGFHFRLGWVFGVLVLVSARCDAVQLWPKVEKTLDIAPVWSGHPVGFCLLTKGHDQYVAFYGRDRQLTVARRRLDEEVWTFQSLDSSVGWDSHNYVTMALDNRGQLHVTGNMHVAPLVYFRTEQPGDIGSLRRVPAMVGQQEDRCTYPHFMTGPGDSLIFTYRDGSSGRGNQIYNVYAVESQTWGRLLDRPLLDGRGLMNAYPVGPLRGPDDRFHLCWVWRDTPDCSTNHDVSYARSSDLVHWETANGQAIELPITIETPGVIVDPVPAGGGAINGNTRIGFDGQQRPVVTYHKFDDQGNTQIYNARFEGDGWRIYQASHWDYRWEFAGGGTIHFEIRVAPVKVKTEGTLTQKYSHDQYGSAVWELDETTLQPVGQVEEPRPWPAELGRPKSDVPGMAVRWRTDTGSSGEPGMRYVLRWETLGANRDRARNVTPPPSMLRLYKLKN